MEECSVSDLRKGKSYLFRACAVTAYGKGCYLELSEAVVAEDPVVLPDTPDNLTYSNVKSGSVMLTWSAPDFDGGAKISRKSFEIIVLM